MASAGRVVPQADPWPSQGRKLIRSASARGSLFGDTESCRSGVLPSSRESSPGIARELRKRGFFSNDMRSGDGMREALTHCPVPMFSRRATLPVRPTPRCNESESGTSWSLPSSRPESSTVTPRRVRSAGRARSVDSLSSRYSTESRFKPRDTISECFSDEIEERQQIRLRGEGQDIGQRGKASVGVPWRQLPAYDRIGMMQETGDPYAHDALKRAVPMSYKRRAEFSAKHSGRGIKGVLAPVEEDVENVPPKTPAQESREPSVREAWLDLVKRRAEAKFVSPLVPSRKDDAKDVQAQEDKRGLHFVYKQQKMRVPDSSASVCSADACPYSRDDTMTSSRHVRTPVRRNNLAPPSMLIGALLSPQQSHREVPGVDTPEVAVRTEGARRDWQYFQEKREIDNLVADSVSAGAKGPTAVLNRSVSARSFASSREGPSSSNVCRGRAVARPRWK